MKQSILFKFFFLLVSLQLQLIQCATNSETVLLTLQYHNGMTVSKEWDQDDLNKIMLFKTMFSDLSDRSKTVPLNTDQIHITHEYLKNLITGTCSKKNLKQYILDYGFFIGNQDIKLNGEAYKTVKEKILKTHFNLFCQNSNDSLFDDFAYFDLDKFLKVKLPYPNLEKFSFESLTSEGFVGLGVNDIIEIISSVMDVTVNSGTIYPCTISVTFKNILLIHGPALFSLIRLIAWKKYTEIDFFDTKGFRVESYSKSTIFSEFSLEANQIKISLHNFFLLGLNIEPVISIAKKISFVNCQIEITNNDIATLRQLRGKEITEAFHISKHLRRIDFTGSHIDNPDKLLDLIDTNRRYYTAISLKNTGINPIKLYLKRLWCKKLALLPVGMQILLAAVAVAALVFMPMSVFKFGTIACLLFSFIIIRKFTKFLVSDTPEMARKNGGAVFI